MKGRMTLHNLGGGLLSEKFSEILSEVSDKFSRTQAEIDNRSKDIIDAMILHVDIRIDEQMSLHADGHNKSMDEARKNIAEVIKGFEDLRSEFREKLHDIHSEIDDKAASMRSTAIGIALETRDEVLNSAIDESNLILKTSYENMLETMRQNVYIIELLRELFDKEPRYDPRRWYDHGWM